MDAVNEQRLVPSLFELDVIAEQIGNDCFLHLQYLDCVPCLGRALGVRLEGEVEGVDDAADASCEVEVVELLAH